MRRAAASKRRPRHHSSFDRRDQLAALLTTMTAQLSSTRREAPATTRSERRLRISRSRGLVQTHHRLPSLPGAGGPAVEITIHPLSNSASARQGSEPPHTRDRIGRPLRDERQPPACVRYGAPTFDLIRSNRLERHDQGIRRFLLEGAAQTGSRCQQAVATPPSSVGGALGARLVHKRSRETTTCGSSAGVDAAVAA